MTFDAFRETYAPTSGPLRLGNWECTDAERPGGRIGPQARHYQATIAVGDRIGTSRASAGGPIGALTEGSIECSRSTVPGAPRPVYRGEDRAYPCVGRGVG